MKKGSSSYRVGKLSSRSNISVVRHFLSPRISVPDTDADGKPLDTTKRTAKEEADIFIPFESERDHLGRLKSLNSTQTTSMHPPGSTTRRLPSMPQLQRSIYSNLREEGVTAEPVDLSPEKFKVADGFERQINIIIRNKEFMKFLKDEKDKKPIKSSGFLTQPRDAKRSTMDVNMSPPGAYDVNYSQVWPKTSTVLIKPERKKSTYGERQQPYIVMRNISTPFKRKRAANLGGKGHGDPFALKQNYQREDSEDREKRELDEYFKQQFKSNIQVYQGGRVC